MSEDPRVWDVYESPLGPLVLRASVAGLSAVYFPERVPRLAKSVRDPSPFGAVRHQLDEYFAGRRHEFDLPLDLAGTPFHLRVWQELRRIPYGTTTTYGELARAVGRPDIVRAVGGAVARTPVPIIVPCHRVIGANGALTGYGGGLHRKQALLELERRGTADEGFDPAAALHQLALL
jgi:methylated-DNA-[protein]-cysteine S-methyltransferase